MTREIPWHKKSKLMPKMKIIPTNSLIIMFDEWHADDDDEHALHGKLAHNVILRNLTVLSYLYMINRYHHVISKHDHLVRIIIFASIFLLCCQLSLIHDPLHDPWVFDFSFLVLVQQQSSKEKEERTRKARASWLFTVISSSALPV